MEAWIIVCWFLNRPADADNIWVLDGKLHHTEQECRQIVQFAKEAINPPHDCSCYPTFPDETEPRK